MSISAFPADITSAPSMGQDFKDAAHGQAPQTAAQEGTQQTQGSQTQGGGQEYAADEQSIKGEQELPEPGMHLRPDDPQLVKDVHEQTQREEFMNRHKNTQSQDLGPKF